MKAPKKILLTAALSLSVAACERIPADNKLGKIIEQTQDTTVALLQTNDSVIQQRDQQTELEQTKKTIDSIEAQEERNIYTIIKSGVIIDRVTQKTFPLPAGIHIPYKYVDQTNSTPEHIRIRTENFAGSIDSSLLAPYKGEESSREKPTKKIIRVHTATREMEVYDEYGSVLKKKMSVGLGSNGDTYRDKTAAFDGNIPKGKYYICSLNPASRFGKTPQSNGVLGSLMISYPNKQDAREGLLQGTINRKQYDKISAAISTKKEPPQNTALGNHIMIHGGGSDSDRTAGCIGLSDEDMLWLYEFVPKGTDVIIE